MNPINFTCQNVLDPKKKESENFMSESSSQNLLVQRIVSQKDFRSKNTSGQKICVSEKMFFKNIWVETMFETKQILDKRKFWANKFGWKKIWLQKNVSLKDFRSKTFLDQRGGSPTSKTSMKMSTFISIPPSGLVNILA